MLKFYFNQTNKINLGIWSIRYENANLNSNNDQFNNSQNKEIDSINNEN